MANSFQRPSYLDPNKPENRALLNTIRYAEGTWANGTDVGYHTNFGGDLFNDLTRHPEKLVRSRRYSSDAAGAYQFLSPTWKERAKKLGLKDFGKESQDIAALDYAREKLLGGSGDAAGGLAGLGGQLSKDQFAALGKAWAGLPWSPYGQTSTPNDELASRFNSFYSEQLKKLQGQNGGSSASSGTTETTSTQSTSPVVTRNDDGSQRVNVPGGTEINITLDKEGQTKDPAQKLLDSFKNQILAGFIKGPDFSKFTNIDLYGDVDEYLA